MQMTAISDGYDSCEIGRGRKTKAISWTCHLVLFNTDVSEVFEIISENNTVCVCVWSGLAVGLDPQGYGNPDFCWLSVHDTLIWSFAGPIFVVVLVCTYEIYSKRQIQHVCIAEKCNKANFLPPSRLLR